MPTAKILILGPSPARAGELEALVRAGGFAVVRVDAGEDAIERARTERPDLIVLDVPVPETDGYEVCRELRGDRAVGHIPIVAIATRLAPASPLWAHLQGASDFVDVPYSAERVLRAIRNALV